ncbi:hypothetical protein K1719_036881 [Acacia pycnantha]|nr:hypothetical protein K1719_036881 [Acacia pycnantha]
MEGNHDRSWIYNRLTDRRELTQVFLEGLEKFIQFALANSNNSSRKIREICVSELNVEKLRHLEASMPITLYKLEMVFPPSMFDSMEHLPVHLAYEVKVGGPQQYRWMYPFERFLRTLKHKIKNPRYVEGSITEAYLVEEAAKFASYYYPPEMMSRWRGVPRNDDAGDTRDQKSIFNFPGRVVGKRLRSTLDGRDKRVAEWYILNNCEEAAQYLK